MATHTSRSLFSISPGEARAPVRMFRANTGTAGSCTIKGKPGVSSQGKGTKTNRYLTKTCYHSRIKLTKGPESEPPRFAGHLAKFLPNWRCITIDPEILDMVVGYKLELTSPPVQHWVKGPLHFSLTESWKIVGKILDLLLKGALTKATPDSDQFLSNLFLVPKWDGDSRLVINIKDINTYLQYNHFKMEGIHLMCDLMRPNDWLSKIDLKDAYFVIPIWENHKKYFRFRWTDSSLQFTCLPFCLAVAPRLFTKIRNRLLLSYNGIRLIVYLDDLHFMNSSEVGLQQNMITTPYLLEHLGFVIFFEK